ncbi:hypothetical protein FDH65_gp20 [Arthrobacter phage Circum]|uniref:Uncharacterized protein n=1 Tax=Arthrobacter phage Circum TaxID=1772295 RepID=A0A0U4JX46_9CAUD|nr:hypothetical protein FDH65_gp20 [Arthrobacter phage Circum]ALY08706.1 hypothetical protein CIRCUM_20 [Arthrobacter phage Circum]
MTGRAIIAPLSFGDTTLPKIGINYVPPLQNAIHDWSVENLQLGLASSWSSTVSSATMTGDLGNPQVVMSGAHKAVRFNGTTDRMRVPFTYSGERTIVVVYRFTALEASQMAIYGYNGYNSGCIITDSNSTFMVARTASSSVTLRPNPDIVPDTNWHIGIFSMSNTNPSVFRHDSREVSGMITVTDMDGFALGRSGGGDFLAPTEYRRVALLSGLTTPDQRAAIVAQLAAQYGITV